MQFLIHFAFLFAGGFVGWCLRSMVFTRDQECANPEHAEMDSEMFRRWDHWWKEVKSEKDK